MGDEFKPIEKDVKDALTKTAEDVEKGYPEHLKELAERAEKVVAGGSKKVDEEHAGNIKKILDDLDANKTRTDITPGAKAAADGKLKSKLTSILDPEGEAGRTSDLNKHISEIDSQGHAPGRHLNPDAQALQDRLGDTKFESDGVTPKLKTAGSNVGHVASENFVDPLTGTTTDGVTGNAHRCGPYATKFNNPEDMATADDYFRAQIAAGKTPGPTPISEVLGPDGHQDLTGVYKDPADPSKFQPVDFENGTIRPVYLANGSGGHDLITMFPEPAPGKHP
jgi:hypothetical protein